MDLDRLVKLVEAEVLRLLSEEAKNPPPLPPQTEGEASSVLVISLHNSPAQSLIERLQREGKKPIIWQKGMSLEGFKEIWLSGVKLSDVAKMALGLFDTPPLEAVLSALSNGMKVFAEPLKLPPNCPPSLANLFNSYWETLLSFGITPWEEQKAPSVTSPPQRMIITQEDIWEAKGKGLQVLLLPSGSIVTDMARELAERLGIQIKEAVQS